MHLTRYIWKLTTVVAGLCLSHSVHAWYPQSAYQTYAPYYSSGPWPAYGNFGYAPGYRGYVEPRIHIRGRINRYGDYWMNFRISGISKQDMYTAWLWYNYLQQY